MSDASLIAVLGLAAGVLALDATAAFQVMVSQPLVAGSVAGLIVGDLPLGALVGSALQMVWVGALPVGAMPFPDVAPASVVGVGVAYLLERGGVAGGWSLGAGLAAALVAGATGQAVIGCARALNQRFAESARLRAERGDAGGVRAAVVLGLVTRFCGGFIVAAAFLGLASAVLGGLLPDEGPGGFPTLLWAAPVGAAVVASGARGLVERLYLVGGLAVGLVIVAVM